MRSSNKKRTSQEGVLSFFKSVSKNGDTVAENFGDQVNDPSDQVTDTGAKNKNTNNECYEILGLNKTDDTVYAADDGTEQELKDDLKDLRERFICAGDRTTICHFFFSYVDLISHKLYDIIIIS